MFEGGSTSFNAETIAPSIPGRLGLAFLNGEPTISDASVVLLVGLPSSGGVPAVAVVEFADPGVPADGDSEVYVCGDFFAEGSDTGSAECCRLSYRDISIGQRGQ